MATPMVWPKRRGDRPRHRTRCAQQAEPHKNPKLTTEAVAPERIATMKTATRNTGPSMVTT